VEAVTAESPEELRKRIDQVLELSPKHLGPQWIEIDRLISLLPSENEQLFEWQRIADLLSTKSGLKGHPYFRLGVLHLLRDADEQQAISFLEKAYSEDQVHDATSGQLSHRKAAYRLLALVKGYFQYLSEKKALSNPDWEAEQFKGRGRRQQIETLLIVYDRSIVHPLDVGGHTYQSFFHVMKDRALTRFAIENYFCAEELLLLMTLQHQQAFRAQHEYPLARAIVGLQAGVLEALLADRLPGMTGAALGGLMRKAHAQSVIVSGSRLAALGSLLLYLRKHIHADRDAARAEYFIDINVARGCKAALDWVISDMLHQQTEGRWG